MNSDLGHEISAIVLSGLSGKRGINQLDAPPSVCLIQGEDETKASGFISGSDSHSITHETQLSLNENNNIGGIELLNDYLDKVKRIVNYGGSEDVLNAAVDKMAYVSEMLSDLSSSIIAHSRL